MRKMERQCTTGESCRDMSSIKIRDSTQQWSGTQFLQTKLVMFRKLLLYLIDFFRFLNTLFKNHVWSHSLDRSELCITEIHGIFSTNSKISITEKLHKVNASKRIKLQ